MTPSGLIPAHAGKTGRVPVASDKLRAHPRSRGENPLMTYRIDWLQGSSPLTRGKLAQLIEASDSGGLIPAHAGKTSPRHTPRCRGRAHPRSRGENTHTMREMTNELGSSPLTRGKRRNADSRTWHYGLIPAHAGKTGLAHSVIGDSEAHPRSRGENAGGGLTKRVAQGSSPLTRGKRVTRLWRC